MPVCPSYCPCIPLFNFFGQNTPVYAFIPYTGFTQGSVLRPKRTDLPHPLPAQPKNVPKPKNDQKWVFIKYGCVIYVLLESPW